MPIFMKLGEARAAAADGADQDWIPCESLSASIVVLGGNAPQQIPGETTFGDVEVVRLLDGASIKLLQNCVNGTRFEEVEIHVCIQVGFAQKPYLTYKLKNVVISSYTFFHAAASGDPPSEEIALYFTEAEWTYVVMDAHESKLVGRA
jgi:type VI secretion system secreted protein Hcp